eukprot:1285703-Prymnesium_polylepis.1
MIWSRDGDQVESARACTHGIGKRHSAQPTRREPRGEKMRCRDGALLQRPRRGTHERGGAYAAVISVLITYMFVRTR